MPEDLARLLAELRLLASSPNHGDLIAWLPRLRAMARQHLPRHSPLRGGVDSEDLMQEGLVQLVANVDRFRGSTWPQFLAFVDAILAQKKVQQVRRHAVRRREFEPTAGTDELHTRQPTPSVDAMLGEDRRRVRKLINELPEPYRATMTLRLDGLDGEELAGRLGIRRDALRQRLSRAMQMLQERW